LINIYTEHGGTKDETEQLIRKLQTRGTHIFAAKEAEASRRTCAQNHFVFLYSDLEHNDVLDKHRTLQGFSENELLGRNQGGKSSNPIPQALHQQELLPRKTEGGMLFGRLIAR